VSPKDYDDEWQVIWGGARPAGLVQAGRPKSGRLARQGRVGDFSGGIIFPSGLQIG